MRISPGFTSSNLVIPLLNRGAENSALTLKAKDYFDYEGGDDEDDNNLTPGENLALKLEHNSAQVRIWKPSKDVSEPVIIVGPLLQSVQDQLQRWHPNLAWIFRI